MFGHIFFDQVMHRHLKIFRLLQLIRSLAERLGHDSIQRSIGVSHRIGASHHTELKFIAGERKRRSAIAVGGIFFKIRQSRHAGLQRPPLDGMVCRAGLDQLLHNILQLFPEENRNNGRRSLVCPQPVVIAHIGSALPEQVRMGVHRLHNAGQHQQKLDVRIGRVAGIQQVHAIICVQRPVVMLAGAVHPRKGLLMQQAGHAMPPGHLLHGLHHQLVMVHRDIGGLIDGRKLMLRRGHLIVLCLGSHPQLPQF